MKATRSGIFLGDDRQALLAKLQSVVTDLAAPDFPHPSSIPVMIDKWKVSRREVPCLFSNNVAMVSPRQSADIAIGCPAAFRCGVLNFDR
ncbi:hypothetical protein [Rhizobium sp. 768_B6_N1_8]|uniref:hypothetical protein n=1 Tax=unclassified Rhizobium TaxID=2613769 RepID=UPI003F2378AF